MHLAFYGLALLSALCFVGCAGNAAPASPRETLSLDRAWRFHLGETAAITGQAATDHAALQWHFRPEPRGAAAEKEPPTFDASWQPAAPGQDVFDRRAGWAWFHATLPALAGPNRAAAFQSVDDNATVFLNGQRLAEHKGWNEPFEVDLDPAWRTSGPNELLLLVQNTAGVGGIATVTLSAGGAPPLPPAALPSFDDSTWRSLDLPHDFVVEGTFDPKADRSHGFLPFNVGWYRRAFTLTEADRARRLWIEFDGVYRNSCVWLNGKFLGRHLSGYTSFRYDITEAANFGGRNVLVVQADARQPEGWWYEGGGIYRHVWLVKTEPVHFAPESIFVTTTLTALEKAENTADPRAAVHVQAAIANAASAPAGLNFSAEILDPSGRTVATASQPATVAPGAAAQVSADLTVAHVDLWDIGHGAMYTLVSSLRQGDKLLDRVQTPFGIREVRFDPDRGFFLNGRPVKIQGTCNHQDFAGVGIAMPDRLHAWRVALLQQMGSNAYRFSHNVMAEELLDACDRAGMLVLDENRKLGDSPEILSQVQSMVLRDRNHPSIFMWSLCNEEALQGTDQGRKMGQAMIDTLRKFDTTRPITAAMNYGYGGGLSNLVDVQGFNYNIGQYAPYRQKHPAQPLFGSETSSALTTRGIYANDAARGYMSAYDTNAPSWGLPAEAAWKPLAKNPWMAGGFVWTGFDYKGEPTPYEWPCINSHFGIIDIAGFPKDNFYYYQAWWSKKPVLNILPHWNWPGREGQEIDVWVHSNCRSVELFLNGRSLGAQTMPPLGHLSWKVPYAPGTLLARGITPGRPPLETALHTTGQPAALALEIDAPALFPKITGSGKGANKPPALAADGRDIALITVRVTDAQGRTVPTADNKITFEVSGPARILGVGNGDPSSHEPDKANARSAFNGLARVILQSTRTSGAVTLTAQAAGLPPARFVLESIVVPLPAEVPPEP